MAAIGRDDPRKRKRYVSIDVGTRNLGVVELYFNSEEARIVVTSADVLDIRDDTHAKLHAILSSRTEPSREVTVVVESQPVIGNACVVRANSLVEGAILMYCMTRAMKAITVRPVDVKRFFRTIATGNYRRNKQSAMELVETISHEGFPPECCNEHICDAILNAMYAIGMQHGNLIPTLSFSL